MSNKKAIKILNEMIKENKEYPDNDYNSWLRGGIKEAKFRIEALPDDWISADNPPSHFKNVLVISYWIISIASYDQMYDSWVYNDEIAEDDVITFWKELPNPPIPKK